MFSLTLNSSWHQKSIFTVIGNVNYSSALGWPKKNVKVNQFHFPVAYVFDHYNTRWYVGITIIKTEKIYNFTMSTDKELCKGIYNSGLTQFLGYT